jgi:tetratricopeptide (TPR) repeat protein
MILKKFFVLFSISCVTFALWTLAVCVKSDAQEVSKDEAYYNKNGISYFNKGYYKLMPKNNREEASQNFELAITEFKKAIAINRNYVQAHRNLGRVYYVQKKYIEAAEQYKKVIDLNPSDIDTYVIIALAYINIQKYAEAKEHLKIAKTFTTNERIIQQLDDYIEKIEEEERLK